MSSQPPVQFISVLYWNACSLIDKIHELYNHLSVNQVDICCVSETCFGPNINIPAHSDFQIHRCDRLITDNTQRRSGGVAIFVRRTLQHSLLSLPRTRILECIGIQVPTRRGSIDFFSVYLPGGSLQDDIKAFYQEDIRVLTNRNNSFFILGDLNSKHRSWNCATTNTAGRILNAEQQHGNFIIFFPPEPTHYPFARNNIPSTIDLTLTNGLTQFSQLETITSSSDHQMVSFKVHISE